MRVNVRWMLGKRMTFKHLFETKKNQKKEKRSYPEIIILSALIAYSAMIWPGGAAICFCLLTSSLFDLYLVNVQWRSHLTQTDWQTHTAENITFPQLRWWTVKMHMVKIINKKVQIHVMVEKLQKNVWWVLSANAKAVRRIKKSVLTQYIWKVLLKLSDVIGN